MIVIVDYGMGNLRSVFHKIGKITSDVKLSSKPEDIEKADKIILPGVGSFAAGIKNLRDYNLISIMNKKVIEDKIPILGICLGMQLFTRHSEEGNADGLGWIDTITKRFTFDGENTKLRIPHVGWNTLNIKRESPIFMNIPLDYRFYFTHSYHVCCNDKKNILATTNYGYDFISVIQKENIVGMQFHPEKSHQDGIKIIKNFIDYI